VEQVSCIVAPYSNEVDITVRPPFVKQISDGLDNENTFTFFDKRVIKFSAFQ